MRYFVGVDVGGTNIVVGLLDDAGQLLDKKKQSTEAERGSESIISKIADAVRQLLQENALHVNDVQAVGIGVPGFVDPQRGICQFSANLHWRDEPVAEKVQRQLGIPVFIDNDVRMYVYGEAMHGAGQGGAHVLGLTLGTGIAAAVVSGGQLYYGNRFMAGELGHIRMEGETAPCNCGLHGCLETVASATGIVRLARERLTSGLGSGQSSLLQQSFAEAPERLTARDVSVAYDRGDELAKQVFVHAGTQLGRALSYAVMLFSPDVIVIGGGLAAAGERLLQPVRETLKAYVLPVYWDNLSIRVAQLQGVAGVVGSALFAKQRRAQLQR
ncbi:ROK family protein [Numidum massiliense]|uniref:ROK family protein n=1 Tax=Numidum massiliense TaxID=1522315 RepID=UPI0006D54CE4|nr:ROK family protein [Numidum massiliense]